MGRMMRVVNGLVDFQGDVVSEIYALKRQFRNQEALNRFLINKIVEMSGSAKTKMGVSKRPRPSRRRGK